MHVALAAPNPVTLAELQAAADLQTRVDRKYVVPQDQANALVDALAGQVRVLQIGRARDFAYQSVYFDTPALDSFYGAARGRRRRFKVRTRTYVDSGLCLLELKRVGGRGETVKVRLPYEAAHAHHLTTPAEEFLTERGLPDDVTDSLTAVLVTRYRRATLLADDGSRATIDSHLTFGPPHDDTANATMPGCTIIETKSTGSPTVVDRWLWAHSARPCRVSKLGTGLAALHPQLPANKWHRTLERHVRTT